MAITPISLVLLMACALSLSAFDLLRKLLSGHLAPLPMVFGLALASTPLFGLLLFFDPVSPESGYTAPALTSISLNLVAHLAFIHAIRIAPLSVSVPLLSLTPVFVSLVAVVLLGEWPSPLTWIGILLVVGGAMVLHRPRRTRAEDGAMPRQVVGRAGRWGSLWMVLAAFCWSLTLPFDKLAVQRANMPFHGLVLCAGIGLGAFVLLLVQQRVGDLVQIRRAPWLFLSTLLASTLALGFQLLALEKVLVSVLETFKRGLGNLLAVFFGRVFFGEALGSKWMAALVMAVGVALILL